MKKTMQNQRNDQLFARAVTNGVLSERDRLLTYSVGEYFNEKSLFIEEGEKIKKKMEEQANK